jgi:hypothetical protein
VTHRCSSCATRGNRFIPALLHWAIAASAGDSVGMRRSHVRFASGVPGSAFAGFRFPPEVIVLAVRWYLRYGLSYRDVEELLVERGIEANHVTVFWRVQHFTPLLAEAARPARRPSLDDQVRGVRQNAMAGLGPDPTAHASLMPSCDGQRTRRRVVRARAPERTGRTTAAQECGRARASRAWCDEVATWAISPLQGPRLTTKASARRTPLRRYCPDQVFGVTDRSQCLSLLRLPHRLADTMIMRRCRQLAQGRRSLNSTDDAALTNGPTRIRFEQSCESSALEDACDLVTFGPHDLAAGFVVDAAARVDATQH